MNIKDIALEAGVSISTVSRVLNHASNVSKITQQKVIEVVQRNGFILNQGGKNLQKTRTNQILIILPTLSNTFFSLVVKGIINTCYSLGWNTYVGVTEYSNVFERQFISQLLNHQIDGIISLYSYLPVEFLEKISLEVPYLQVANPVSSPNISSVSIDDAKAGYEVTQYLLKRGHRKIGIISGSRGCSERREEGYLQAIQAAGLAVNPDYIIKADYQYDNDFEYDSGIVSCERLLSLPKPPTAIVTIFDTFAVGACKCILARGMTPGKDIAVIGFDNSSITKVFSPSISTISQPRYEMGCLAAKVLLEQIETGCLTPKKLTLPFELILRDSSNCSPPQSF